MIKGKYKQFLSFPELAKSILGESMDHLRICKANSGDDVEL